MKKSRDRRDRVESLQHRLRFVCSFLVCLIVLTGCRKGESVNTNDKTNTTIGGFRKHSALQGEPPPSLNLPPTNDPAVVMERMVTAYHGLKAGSFQIESDLILLNDKMHQTTQFRFQQEPAKVAMMFEEPVSGTTQIYADGSSYVMYEAVTNSYKRRSLQKDVPGVCAIIDARYPQILSPLTFLIDTKTVSGVSDLRLAGTEQALGKTAYKVEGKFTPDFVKRVINRILKTQIVPEESRFTLWIDDSTYILLKTSIEFHFTVEAVDDKNKKVTYKTGFIYKETLPDPKANPAFKEDDFRFLPPKGAKETPVEKEDLK